MKKTQDQKLVDAFLKDLVKEIVKKHKKDIDFIILYGSAARGEFIAGASDIDLIIQTKNAESVEPIKQFAARIFWKLDKKHKTQFKKVCAAKKSKTLLSKIIKEFEEKTGLYVPVFVFGPEDIDWRNGRYLKKGYAFGANVFGPVASVFNKLRIEGKILHGRDIRKIIKPKINLWERFKTIMLPVWLTFGASLIVPFAPKKAVKNCTKAIFYEIEAALFYLDQLKINDTLIKKKQFKQIPEFRIRKNSLSKFIELNIDIKYKSINPKKFDIIEEAIHYKTKGFRGSRKKARKFVWRTWKFINALNFIVMVKRLFGLY